MSIGADILPASTVEEMVRALVKAYRAFQMYLPNNPMFEKAHHALRASFAPIWEVLDDLTLMVDETRLVWEEQVVYDHGERGESFAWALYKDGMRFLVLRKGVEQEEIVRFLGCLARARHLASDASDDLLTLLWAQDFTGLDYRFAEVVTDTWVYDPQALALTPQADAPSVVAETVRAEVAAARPEGMVDIEEFESTLYFLDEVEIAELRRQVALEYERDVRPAAFAAVLDTFELVKDPAVREEILGILEAVFPNFLAKSDFEMVAELLRELRAVNERLVELDPALRRRIEGFQASLSQPEVIVQFLQALDEAVTTPDETALGEVLRELRPAALSTILDRLPSVGSAAIRTMIGGAAQRLATAHPTQLIDALQMLSPEALPDAIRLAGRIRLQPAIPTLGQLARHPDAGVREAAVEVLAGFGTPGALAAVGPMVDDPERAVRAKALQAVVTADYKAVLSRLHAVVTGETGAAYERAERRHFFEAYATLGGEPVVAVLRDLLEPQGLFRRKPPTEVRTCAVYALGKVRTPESRALLEGAALDKDLPVRHAATTTLREWGR